ncbi:hypothetical protein D3C75_1040170 [compost metagenome]
MKGSRCHKQNIIRLHRSVFSHHRRSFDDRQYITLHPFTGNIGSRTFALAGNLIDFIDKNNAGLLGTGHGFLNDVVHVNQLGCFILNQHFACFLDRQLAFFGPLGQ